MWIGNGRQPISAHRCNRNGACLFYLFQMCGFRVLRLR